LLLDGSKDDIGLENKVSSNPCHTCAQLALPVRQRKAKAPPNHDHGCNNCVNARSGAADYKARAVHKCLEQDRAGAEHTLGEPRYRRGCPTPNQRAQTCALGLYLENVILAGQLDDKELSFFTCKRHNKESIGEVKDEELSHTCCDALTARLSHLMKSIVHNGQKTP
jgi:hypothetical protein